MNKYLVGAAWVAVLLAACGKYVEPVKGERGPAGTNGIDGHVGAPGQDGAKGDQGDDGAPGAPGTTIERVALCPTIPGAYPEVLLRIDGVLYGVYSSGSKIHWVEIIPGTYQTTDGRNCVFTVTPTGEVL